MKCNNRGHESVNCPMNTMRSRSSGSGAQLFSFAFMAIAEEAPSVPLPASLQASGDAPPGATATARATDIISDSEESDSQATPKAKSGKMAARRDPDAMQDIVLDTPVEPIQVKKGKDHKGLMDPKPKVRRVQDANLSLDDLMTEGRMRQRTCLSSAGKPGGLWGVTLRSGYMEKLQVKAAMAWRCPGGARRVTRRPL